jgi:hypothetical protein
VLHLFCELFAPPGRLVQLILEPTSFRRRLVHLRQCRRALGRRLGRVCLAFLDG